MKKVLCSLLVWFFTVGLLTAQQPLPIRRVLLYKNGMAYIVRTGELRSPLRLTFHPDEMNDVLKSFTAWNPDSSTLYAVGYTTGIPAMHSLNRFPFDLVGRKSGLAGFLEQVQGADLRLKTAAGNVSGRLVSVNEEERAARGQAAAKEYRLTLLLGQGNVRSLWLSDVRSLEFQDTQLREQLRSYLQVLAEGRQDVTRDITVYPNPNAGRVNIGYVQQFPIWKTSYRIDMTEVDGRIQGWTQIDNPTGESWDNVDLTLVSGMPVSFKINLYEPLYASRRTIGMPETRAAAPRNYQAPLTTAKPPNSANTVYGIIRDATGAVIPGVDLRLRNSRTGEGWMTLSDQRGYFELRGVTTGQLELSAELPGFVTYRQPITLLPGGTAGAYPVLQVGSSSQNVEVTVAADSLLATSSASIGLRPPDAEDLFNEAEVSQIQDFFEYKIPFPVRLASRQSALLPFLNAPLKAERVSIFKADSDESHPLKGARIENNSGVPLDSGPVTFFQEGRYAGESVIEHTSLGERRLVSFGVDYDVQITSTQNTPKERMARLTAGRGVVRLYKESAQTTEYEIKNKSTETKIVLIEHPRHGTLKDLKAEETTEDYYRFRVDLEPSAEITFPVTETWPRESSIAISTMDRSKLEIEFSGGDIPDNLRSKLSQIVSGRENLADLGKQREPLDARVDSIVQDQTRLRENLKALRDSKEERDLRQKYLDGLTGQEQQINDLRLKINDLIARIADQEAAIAKMISELNWD